MEQRSKIANICLEVFTGRLISFDDRFGTIRKVGTRSLIKVSIWEFRRAGIVPRMGLRINGKQFINGRGQPMATDLSLAELEVVDSSNVHYMFVTAGAKRPIWDSL